MKLKPNNQELLLLGVILLFTALAYLPVMRGDFLADERLLILENPMVQHPSALKDFFLTKFWPGKVQDIYYRPLVISSYALNWKLNQSAPLGYHLFNTLFHLANILLFYLIFRKWFPAQAPLASTIFGLHPVLTEAVAKISGRTDLLATFFVFLGWYLWIVAEGKTGFKKIVIYITISFSFLCGLFSKEMAIIFPVLAFFGDWRLKVEPQSLRQILRSRLLGLLCLLVALLIYLGLRHLALSGIEVPKQAAFISGFSFWQRPLIISRIWVEYLRLLIFPYPLRPDYFYTLKFSPERYPLLLSAFSALFCAVGLFFIICGLRKKNPLAEFGTLWLVSLVPVSHLFPIPPALAERFLYLPSAFYALALSNLISALAKHHRKAVSLATGALLGWFLLLTWFSASLYQDWERNYRDFVRKVPEEKVFHNLLGLNYLERKIYHSAKRQFLWALRLDPQYPEALMNLGVMEYLAGDPNSAVNRLNQTLELSPDYAEAHHNLGKIFYNLGQLEQAQKAFEIVAQLEPENPVPLYELAVIAERQTNLEQAKKHLDFALQIAPWYLPALKLRTRIAIQENDLPKAKELIQIGQSLAPADPELKKLRASLPP